MLDAKDSPKTWRRQYRIRVEHIHRRISNRHMMDLTIKIRELLLSVMSKTSALLIAAKELAVQNPLVLLKEWSLFS